MQIHIYIYTQHHKDTINKETSEDFFINKCTSYFICNVWKGYTRFACERELETEQKLQNFEPTLMAVSVVSFSFSRTAQPEARGLTLLAFSTTSYSATSLGPNSIGSPSPFGLVWLSLPHLVYISVRALTATVLTSVLTELYNCSTTTQSPTRSLKHMFDRHQPEITVIQFTGHSLPVRQSMSVPWEFFYLVPFRQPISAHVISSHNCH